MHTYDPHRSDGRYNALHATQVLPSPNTCHPDPFEHKLGRMHAWNELPRRIRSPLPVANARTLIEDKTGTQGCVQQVHITHTMLNAFVCQRIMIMSLDQVVPNGIEPL
jgi:hypothetical protein